MTTRSRTFLLFLATLGLGISLWLCLVSIRGGEVRIAGCGSGSGCAEVLSSRWSEVFFLPVSLFAAAVYAWLALSLWRRNSESLQTIAVILAVSAAWFLGLQFFVLQAFCPWCLAAHVTGLITAVVLLWATWPKEPASIRRGAWVGTLCVALLAVGQVMGPQRETHLVEGAASPIGAPSVPQPEEFDPTHVHARGTGRIVHFTSGKSFNVEALPHVGDASAPQLLVKYFDYTCDACREMDQQLRTLRDEYGDEIVVVLLPVPLNRQCNHRMPDDVVSRRQACDLAKLSLAAWRGAPESFPEIHRALFARPTLNAKGGRKIITKYLTEEQIDDALENPWIDELLAANADDYGNLVAATEKMPKLLLMNSRVMHGLPKDPDTLMRAIALELGLAR